jgi:PPOX class probable F420-dependent enzyme
VTLTSAERALLKHARRATLATIAPDGRPRLVPVCFVFLQGVIWTPLDEKPKAVSDVRDLARVRDIVERPNVTLLIDRWSEDWSELAWVRLDGRAELADAQRPTVTALRAKYPQYVSHDLDARPMIAITIERTSSWRAISGRD